jgi:tetratricopeptide (TPR) repeat protein
VTLGQKLRSARLEERLTQQQLAGNDLTKSYISEVERGRRTPRRMTLKVLAHRLHKPLSYFLDGASEDGEAEVFLQLGLARLLAGSAQGAIVSLEKALDLAVNQSAEVLQARIELALALVDQQLGSLQRAQRRLDRCLRVLIRSGDGAALAAVHCCLGFVKLGAGDPASALWAFQAGLQFSEYLGQDPLLRTRLHLGIAIAHRKLGDTHAAREALAQALELAHPFRDQHHKASWHLEIADAMVGGGRFEQAFEHLGKAVAIHETLAHNRQLAEIHKHLGELDGDQGNWNAAEGHYRWSIVLHRAADNLPGVAHALSDLAEALLQRASPEAARVVCEGALALLAGEADQDGRAHILRVLGTMHRIAGRREEARIVLEESLTLFGKIDHKNDVRLVRQELALVALEGDDIEEARRHLEALQET